MDDLILPGGKPVIPRKKVICHPNVALAFTLPVDGDVEIHVGNGEAIYELGKGNWRVVSAEAWERLMRMAIAKVEEATAETPDERKVRRHNDRIARRN